MNCRGLLFRSWSKALKISSKNQLRQKSFDIVKVLVERNLVKEIFPKNCTFEDTLLPCAYAGFDATSDSLHIGNLLVLMALFHWQRSENQAIIVVGDTTAQIGDPSGHFKDRKIQNKNDVFSNATSIENSLKKIFQNHECLFLKNKQDCQKSLKPIRILKNSSWYQNMEIVDFFSRTGHQLRLTDLLSRSSVKKRLQSGDGMSCTEFNYQLFQAYDWMHLFEDYNCTVQFGGSDQLGNIVSGYNLISKCHSCSVYGLLLPLIESEAGDKYGKSSGNAIYLSEEKTNPFELYQFFTRLPDSEVEMYLKLFTFYSCEEIKEILVNHKKSPEKRGGQMKIAEAVTLLVHGENGLAKAEEATAVIYHSNYDLLSKRSIKELKEILPRSCIVELIFEANTSVLDVTLKANCFLNKYDAVRIITSGGVHINSHKITCPSTIFNQDEHIFSNGSTLVRVGKRNFYCIIWIK